MALNENDPEVKAICLKLKEKNSELIAVDAKIRVNEERFKHTQQLLTQNHAKRNNIIGGIETLRSLLTELSGDFEK